MKPYSNGKEFLQDSMKQRNVTLTKMYKEIDWEQRRYEIAKDILTAWCSNSDRGTGLGIPKNDSAAAVIYADALIKALKGK